MQGPMLQDWASITEGFVSSFFSLSIANIETTISVTAFEGATGDRYLRRQLQEEEESFVTVFYTQTFIHRTTQEADILATLPFESITSRAAYTNLFFQGSLLSVMDVSIPIISPQ